jgi:hypothetical protein
LLERQAVTLPKKLKVIKSPILERLLVNLFETKVKSIFLNLLCVKIPGTVHAQIRVKAITIVPEREEMVKFHASLPNEEELVLPTRLRKIANI